MPCLYSYIGVVEKGSMNVGNIIFTRLPPAAADPQGIGP